ncbi:MAG: IPT/TIG domain-containing protein, partial [Myxococcota bacterium]|nr:IPT/TIG domain-containing protein [Myxococcota bacterium]
GLRNVKATLGGVESLLTAGFNVKWEPIEITDILPDTISPILEDTLNIVGSGFTSGEEVTVQSCETINTLFFNDTLLKPTLLAGPNPGKYDVNVVNGGNDILIPNGITIFGITDVDPPIAEQGETVTLTFTGFGFRPPVPGQIPQQLQLNAGIETTSSNLQILTENSFSVDVAVGADSPTGVHIVKAIVEPEDLYQEFIGGFTVELPGGGLAAPAVSDISPNNALPGEEVTITLTGSGFSETANVEFGDQVEVVDVETISASSLVATVVLNDMAAPGTRDVSVFTDEGFVTIAEGFTVDTPTLVVTGMVESNVFEKYEKVTTTVEGEGFSTDTTAAASGGAQIIDVVPLSTTQLEVTWDATKNAGCYDLHVYNGDAENVSTAFFCVFGINSLGIEEGGKGQTLTVPLSGGFPEGTDIFLSSSVDVSDITLLNNGNDAEATFSVEPLAVKGPRDVIVEWEGLSDTLEDGFIVAAGPPTITDIEPDVLEPGQTRVVTLKGYNFTNANVSISAEVIVNSITFVNDARIDLDLT